jgi:hypothetical protein
MRLGDHARGGTSPLRRILGRESRRRSAEDCVFYLGRSSPEFEGVLLSSHTYLMNFRLRLSSVLHYLVSLTQRLELRCSYPYDAQHEQAD